MIVVRIFDKEHKYLGACAWSRFDIRNKYAVISCLDKAFTFANARYGVGRAFFFHILNECDSRDFEYIYKENNNG